MAVRDRGLFREIISLCGGYNIIIIHRTHYTYIIIYVHRCRALSAHTWIP